MKNIDKKVIVLKYGSATISDGALELYANEIAELRKQATVIVVSSGSVKLGKELVGSEHSKRVLAAIGSGRLVYLWNSHLKNYGMTAAQILVTHADLKENSQYLQDSLSDVIASGAVPIINENDVLSDIELMKLETGGDNDGLAARIAVQLQADSLLLLSNDVEGYLSEGVVQKCVDLDDIDSNNHFHSNVHGTGGVESKLAAAKMAVVGGVGCVHFGNAKQSYADILDKKLGSCFCGTC